MTSISKTNRTIRRLRIVRLVALVDLVLLIALVSAALTGQKEVVHIIGPLHGINFLLLLVIVGTAALDGIWGWWFPIVILLTAGPPGAFLGEWLIHRRVRAQNLIVQDDLPSKEIILVTNKDSEAIDTFSPVIGETLQVERKEHL